MAELLETHVLLRAELSELAAAAGAEMTVEPDDLGDIEFFRTETDGVLYEFCRHPDAPDPQVISVLSSETQADAAERLGALLKRLGVRPPQVYSAIRTGGPDGPAPAADLRRVREAISPSGKRHLKMSDDDFGDATGTG